VLAGGSILQIGPLEELKKGTKSIVSLPASTGELLVDDLSGLSLCRDSRVAYVRRETLSDSEVFSPT